MPPKPTSKLRQIEAEREDRCDQDLASEIDVEITRQQRREK